MIYQTYFKRGIFSMKQANFSCRLTFQADDHVMERAGSAPSQFTAIYVMCVCMCVVSQSMCGRVVAR